MADRIFDEPVQSVHLHAHHDNRRGWCLQVMKRLHGESWYDAECEWYDDMTRAELVDVIDAVIEAHLRTT